MRDGGITSWDISLYMALLYNWDGSEYQYPASITRREIIALAHIHSLPINHKYMRELVEFGCFQYLPSYNPFLESLAYFNVIDDLNFQIRKGREQCRSAKQQR
jgi:hypothetical protein